MRCFGGKFKLQEEDLKVLDGNYIGAVAEQHKQLLKNPFFWASLVSVYFASSSSEKLI
jgi:hypothetical protein